MFFSFCRAATYTPSHSQHHGIRCSFCNSPRTGYTRISNLQRTGLLKIPAWSCKTDRALSGRPVCDNSQAPIRIYTSWGPHQSSRHLCSLYSVMTWRYQLRSQQYRQCELLSFWVRWCWVCTCECCENFTGSVDVIYEKVCFWRQCRCFI